MFIHLEQRALVLMASFVEREDIILIRMSFGKKLIRSVSSLVFGQLDNGFATDSSS